MTHIFAALGNTLQKLTDPGSSAPASADWSVNHGGKLYAVAADTDGNSYIGGDPGTDNYTHRKIDIDGTIIWSKDHESTIYAAAVDSSGNSYFAGQGTYDDQIALRKYNSAGTQQWTAALNTSLYGIVVAGNGDIYVAGSQVSSKNVWRYAAADGSLVSSWLYPNIPYDYGPWSLAVDSSDYIYTGHDRKIVYSGNYMTFGKYDGSGVVDYKDTSASVRGLFVDSSGNVYAAGGTLKKYNSAGTLQWTYSALGYGVTVDSSGNSYLASYVGSPTFKGYLYKVNSSGSTVWSYQSASASVFQAVAIIEALAINAAAPALPLGIHLGSPGSLRSLEVPALPWALAVGDASRDGGTSWLFQDAPSVALALGIAIPALALEYTAARVLEFYRAQLGDLVLPVSMAQIRKTLTGVEITLTCPTNTAALRAAIAARSSAWLGVRWVQRLPDGGELSDYTAQCPLTSVQTIDRGISGEIRLRGIDPFVLFSPRVRTARGVEYRNTINGVSRVRCAPDHYLGPGDTLNLPGGATLIAREVVYTLEPGRGVMEVAE